MQIVLAATGMVTIPPAAGGAIESYVGDIARILCRIPGINVTVVSNVRPGWPLGPPRVEVVPTHSPLDRYPFGRLSTVPAHVLGGTLTALALGRLPQGTFNDGVLHLNEEVSAYLFSVLEPDRKFVLTFHNPPSELNATVYSESERVLRLADGLLYRRTLRKKRAHIIVQTSYLRDFLMDRWSVDGRAISVLPPPLDTDLFTPPAMRERGSRILFVGRLDARKNVADLLRVMERVPSAATLTVVGSGHLQAALRKFAQSRGLESRVRFLTGLPLRELIQLYRHSDLLVFPSHLETYGKVIAEAAACGTPSLIPNVPMYGDFLSSGVAVDYSIGDLDSLASRISELLANHAERESLGKRARDAIVDICGPPTYSGKLMSVYEKARA